MGYSTLNIVGLAYSGIILHTIPEGDIARRIGGKAVQLRCALSLDLKVLGSLEDTTGRGRELQILDLCSENTLLLISVLFGSHLTTNRHILLGANVLGNLAWI